MSEIFLHVFNMSISASYIVLAILLLRLFMKKAPKWISVALWGVVGLRLICPFSIESILSLIPSAETVSPDIMTGNLSEPFYVDSYIDTGFSGVNNTIAPIISGSSVTVAPEKEVNLLKLLIPIFAILWLVGILAMVIYTLVSYLKLKKSIGAAVLYKENIYQSENVASPFILGIIKPRIYLPFSISEQSAEHVIAHEKAHLRRKDHLWKPLGFLLLAVYWFNPLMWLGYILLCRDIELACDEKVIKELDCDARADYSEALLRCGVKRKSIAACPLAFGEVGVKARIKSVLNYKKPAFWIIIVALVLCVVIAICFLTNPVSAGVKDISVKNIKDDSLELVMKYYFPSGNYGVRAIPDDEGENLGNGMREYDGSLGEHRILISFGDTEPTKAFREEFPTGEAIEINSSPRVCVKRVHLNDNGFDLYVGFDNPVSIEEIDSEKLNTFFGKVKIPVSFVEDSDEGNEEGSENIGEEKPLPDPELLAAYPEYFGINTAKGLDIYVWQMAEDHYAFGLLPHIDEGRRWDDKELLALKDASADTMKKILSYYELDRINTHIIPWLNPISSYMPDYVGGGRYAEATYIDNIKFMLFGVKPTEPSWLDYDYKEIENIVLDTKGNAVEEAEEDFFQDDKYVYSFSSRISRYLTVIYKDGTTENIKDALANRHIKISDLDRFGTEYFKTESNVDRIVTDSMYGWEDATEGFYEDEKYIYIAKWHLSYRTTVYYKDGTSERLNVALENRRIMITALEWHGISYEKLRKTKMLSMEALYELVSKYGEELSWKHFSQFYHVETGSGLYIRQYPIDNNYQLLIGGDSPAVTPYYIYLVACDGSGDHIDVRTESIDDFRYLKESVVDVPEDFSFSLNWGVEGISSYDSATGKLVKDNEAYYVAEFTTDYTFKALDMEYIYILLMDLNIDKYPDEYAPNVNPISPSEKIILTVRMGNKVKTVTVEAAAFFNDYSDRDATAFFYTCNTIAGMLEATDEWKALPDYDRFFE